LIEDPFEIFDDCLSKNVRIRYIFGVFETFVAEPADIQAGLVAVDEYLIPQNSGFTSTYSLLPELLRLESVD